MKKLLVLLTLSTALSAQADEQPIEPYTGPTELYMKLDASVGGGFVTLTEDPCEIAKVRNPYEFKAIIQTSYGTRRGCWNTQVIPGELQGKIIPYVHVVEEELLEDGTRLYNIGMFARYYFKSTKE